MNEMRVLITTTAFCKLLFVQVSDQLNCTDGYKRWRKACRKHETFHHGDDGFWPPATQLTTDNNPQKNQQQPTLSVDET